MAHLEEIQNMQEGTEKAGETKEFIGLQARSDITTSEARVVGDSEDEEN